MNDKNQKEMKEQVATTQEGLKNANESLKRWNERDKAIFDNALGPVDDEKRAFLTAVVERASRMYSNFDVATHFRVGVPVGENALAYAYVIAGDVNHVIHINPAFWILNDGFAVGSKAGTLFHEASHFLDIGGGYQGWWKGTVDYVENWKHGTPIYGRDTLRLVRKEVPYVLPHIAAAQQAWFEDVNSVK